MVKGNTKPHFSSLMFILKFWRPLYLRLGKIHTCNMSVTFGIVRVFRYII